MHLLRITSAKNRKNEGKLWTLSEYPLFALEHSQVLGDSRKVLLVQRVLYVADFDFLELRTNSVDDDSSRFVDLKSGYVLREVSNSLRSYASCRIRFYRILKCNCVKDKVDLDTYCVR